MKFQFKRQNTYSNARNPGQALLDLDRRDVLTTADDKILVPAQQVHIAILIHIPLITGRRPVHAIFLVTRTVVLRTCIEISPEDRITALVQLTELASTDGNPTLRRTDSDSGTRSWRP